MARTDGKRTTPGLKRITLDIEADLVEFYGIQAVRLGLTRALLMRAVLKTAVGQTKSQDFDTFFARLVTAGKEPLADSKSIVEEANEEPERRPEPGSKLQAVGPDFDGAVSARIAESQAKAARRKSGQSVE